MIWIIFNHFIFLFSFNFSLAPSLLIYISIPQVSHADQIHLLHTLNPRGCIQIWKEEFSLNQISGRDHIRILNRECVYRKFPSSLYLVSTTSIPRNTASFHLVIFLRFDAWNVPAWYKMTNTDDALTTEGLLLARQRFHEGEKKKETFIVISITIRISRRSCGHVNS